MTRSALNGETEEPIGDLWLILRDILLGDVTLPWRNTFRCFGPALTRARALDRHGPEQHERYQNEHDAGDATADGLRRTLRMRAPIHPIRRPQDNHGARPDFRQKRPH
jgi:hypothetical protein